MALGTQRLWLADRSFHPRYSAADYTTKNKENKSQITNNSSRCVYGFTKQELSSAKRRVYNLYSVAVLEHIDESIQDDVIKECLRVGRMQAHVPGLARGGDPSHINIKTVDEWAKAFKKHAGGEAIVWTMPHIGNDECAFLFCVGRDNVSYPLESIMKRAGVTS